MADATRNPVLQFVHQLVGAAGAADDVLLRRFVEQRDTTAFTALLKRHGPMVLGVCQRLLLDGNDAEDAFQATFLVLARKAGSLRKPDLLGPWLYGVASRAAARLRADAMKRRTKEQAVRRRAVQEPSDELVWSDLRPVLDEEVNRLPEKYRVPFVLCYLEGMTNDKAAGLLGCPTGTVLSRLATARERLRSRLSRRGITLSVGLLATLVAGHASAAVPTVLLTTTARAAGLAVGGQAVAGVISASVIALTDKMLKAMLLRSPLTVLLLLGTLGLATVILAGQGGVVRGTRANEKPSGESAAMNELDKLQGIWVAVAAEKQGEPMSEERVREAKIVFTVAGNRFTMTTAKNRGELKGTLQIDPSKNPRTMDWSALRPEDGKSLDAHGIYDVQGDTLKFCYGEERPTEFKTKPGRELDQRLYVFQRGLQAAVQAPGPVSLLKTLDGFRRKLPEPQGLHEMNGLGVADIEGRVYPDSHLRGVATRMAVKTKADCMLLLTYLKDRDPKMRRIAGYALENVVKVYPNGFSSDCFDQVDSEQHREMVRRFVAGIEKLSP